MNTTAPPRLAATVTDVSAVLGVGSITAVAPCGTTVHHGGGPTSGPVRLGSRGAHCNYERPRSRRRGAQPPADCACGSYDLVVPEATA